MTRISAYRRGRRGGKRKFAARIKPVLHAEMLARQPLGSSALQRIARPTFIIFTSSRPKVAENDLHLCFKAP